MKRLLLIAIVVLNYGCITAQQNEINLQTIYGSKNKDIHQLLRFEGIETVELKFSGKQLIGKEYTILIKEFSNGNLSKVDTLISSKSDGYLQPIDTSFFKFKFYVKTQLNNTIKMTSIFDRFSTTKIYDIKKPKDRYALHSFLKGSTPLEISVGKPVYVLGYFLPYINKKTGWKKYCDVSGSKYNPEDWGKVFSIPNYFLVQAVFD